MEDGVSRSTVLRYRTPFSMGKLILIQGDRRGGKSGPGPFLLFILTHTYAKS